MNLFQLSLKLSPAILTRFIIFLVTSFSQIFLLCFFGNKLTTASENVAKAVYDSDWHEYQNKSVKKGFLLMMQRSQKPAYLTAFKFVKVSREAFTTVSFNLFTATMKILNIFPQIIGSSYSYFTLLKTVNEKAA
jgi:hypothetical protein